MFGPPVRAHVYGSYGIHQCLNPVCRKQRHGSGVLNRAMEPTAGLERIRARRGLADMRLLCAGPGRVGQALDVDASFNGMRLDRAPFKLLSRPAALADAEPVLVLQGPRIGISKAVEVTWRFAETGSRFLSRRF